MWKIVLVALVVGSPPNPAIETATRWDYDRYSATHQTAESCRYWLASHDVTIWAGEIVMALRTLDRPVQTYRVQCLETPAPKP